MTTYNTGNPIGSTDPRDLSDNAQNFDNAVNATGDTWTDRLGVARRTLRSAVGYTGTGTDGAIQSYAAGLVLSGYNVIILYSGEFYRPSASATLPYTTTSTLPDADGNLVSIGDANLRQDLSNNASGSGAALVSMESGPSVEVAVLDRVIRVTSIAAMEAYSAPVGYVFILNEGGRSGVFDVIAGDFSDEVVIDTGKYMVIPLADNLDGSLKVAKKRTSGALTPENFGANETVGVDSAPAFVRLAEWANYINSPVNVLGSETYKFSSDGPVFDVPVRISGNFKVEVSQDISHAFKFTDSVVAKNIEIDFGNFAALSGAAIKTEGSFFFQDCRIENLAGRIDSSTPAMYMIESIPTLGTMAVKDCRFKNATNQGDGILTNTGFTGFLFLRGNVPGSGNMFFDISGNTFDTCKTIYEVGATYSEMKNDMDADAIRTFIDNSDVNTYTRLTIKSKNNTFLRCQKRLYKINHARLVVDGDISLIETGDVSLTEPGMAYLGQIRDGSLEIHNSNYDATVRLECFTTVNITQIQKENKITNVAYRDFRNPTDIGDRNRLFADTSTGQTDWTVNDIRTEGLNTLSTSTAGGAGFYKLNNITMRAAKSLLQYECGGSKGYSINNADCEFNVSDGNAEEISLRDTIINGQPERPAIIKNVLFVDTVERTSVNGFPYAIDFRSDNIRMLNTEIRYLVGAGSLSSLRITGCTGSSIQHSSAERIDVRDTTNFTLSHSSYALLTQSGVTGLRERNNDGSFSFS